MKPLLNDYLSEKLYLITDENIYSLYSDYLTEQFQDFNCQIVVVKPGEQSKSFSVYQNIIEQLLKEKIRKNDLIVAFGGGVVGDLAGFIAATILRGVRLINIPTTLLAMADSSIGGKTGIDSIYGKNLIGSFKQPEVVIVDISLLQTLEEKEYNNGMSEIIKAGLIYDSTLVAELLKAEPNELQFITQAIEVKKQIVTKDPFEKGLRQILNFGHSFGHAIEQYNNYSLKHGYCVALGMDLAIKYGIKHNLTKKNVQEVFYKLLEKYQLPTFVGDSNLYLEQIKHDKKHIQESLNFIVVTEIGKASIIPLKKEDLYDLSN